MQQQQQQQFNHTVNERTAHEYTLILMCSQFSTCVPSEYIVYDEAANSYQNWNNVTRTENKVINLLNGRIFPVD